MHVLAVDIFHGEKDWPSPRDDVVHAAYMGCAPVASMPQFGRKRRSCGDRSGQELHRHRLGASFR